MNTSDMNTAQAQVAQADIITGYDLWHRRVVCQGSHTSAVSACPEALRQTVVLFILTQDELGPLTQASHTFLQIVSNFRNLSSSQSLQDSEANLRVSCTASKFHCELFYQVWRKDKGTYN